MSNDVTGGAKAEGEPPERKGSLAESVAASLPSLPPLTSSPEESAEPPARPGSHARGADEKVTRRDRSGSEVAGSAVRRVREVLATAIITVAVLAAAALALGAALIALHANQDNAIVATVLDLGHRLDGPFADIFTFGDDTVKQTLVNWGIAAVVYLAVGRIVERVVRP